MMRMRTTLLAALPLSLLAIACHPGGQKKGNGGEKAESKPELTIEKQVALPRETKSIIRPESGAMEAEPVPAKRIEEILLFDGGGVTLGETARARLDQLIELPAVSDGGSIILRGHSDSRGTDTANLAVSRARAEAVRDYLVNKGIARVRITVIALGEARPVAPNAKEDGSDNPAGRQRNRRVELVVEPDTAERH